MLCADCANITIPYPDANIKVQIRRYDNFMQLRMLSVDCDFCSLLRNDIGELETESFPDCRRLWGEDVYQKGLQITPIKVFFVSQPGCDITWIYRIDISKVDGYKNGPNGGLGSGYLGGVFFDQNARAFRTAFSAKTRRIDRNPSAKQMMQLASTWYNQCKKDHARCRVPNWTASLLPERVLQIVAPAYGPLGIKLVTPPPGSRRTYTALSYCWGSSPTIILTKASFMKSFESVISIEDVPATFQDAILLTRFIGIRYLWIDALCIIQDSPEDWDIQSASMTNVYSEATLVIGATSGKDSQHGLFNTKGRSGMGEAQLRTALPDGSFAKCFTRSRLEMKEPLDSRAWALQEQRLATRYLSFETMQMRWTCWEDHFDESGNPVSENLVPAFGSAVRTRIDPTAQNSGWTGSGMDDDSAMARWQFIVGQYCKRHLTLSRDKLPALAGLAGIFPYDFPKLSPDTYLAGLWLSQLPQTLLWTTGNITGPRGKRPEQYRAPTWSWSSIDWEHISWIQCTPETPTFTTVHHTERHLLSEYSPYSQITAAKLILQGPIKQGILRPDPLYGDLRDLWLGDSIDDDQACSELQIVRGQKGSGSVADVRFDLGDHYASDHKITHIHCLRISKQAGLAIELCDDEEMVENDGQVWRRSGVVEFPDGSEEWWDDAKTIKLTLI